MIQPKGFGKMLIKKLIYIQNNDLVVKNNFGGLRCISVNRCSLIYIKICFIEEKYFLKEVNLKTNQIPARGFFAVAKKLAIGFI